MTRISAPDHDTPTADPSDDVDAERLDAELTCSAREVWVGYPSLLPAEAVKVLRRSARPWADRGRCDR